MHARTIAIAAGVFALLASASLTLAATTAITQPATAAPQCVNVQSASTQPQSSPTATSQQTTGEQTKITTECENGKLYTITFSKPSSTQQQTTCNQIVTITWQWQPGLDPAKRATTPGIYTYKLPGGQQIQDKCGTGGDVLVTAAKANTTAFNALAHGLTYDNQKAVTDILSADPAKRQQMASALFDSKESVLSAAYNSDQSNLTTDFTKANSAVVGADQLQKIADQLSGTDGIDQNQVQSIAAESERVTKDIFQQFPTIAEQYAPASLDNNPSGSTINTGSAWAQRFGPNSTFAKAQQEQDAAQTQQQFQAQEDFDSAKQEYDQCAAKHSWYSDWYYCSAESQQLQASIDQARAAGCKVGGWTYGSVTTIDCFSSGDNTTGPTQPDKTTGSHGLSNENSSITSGKNEIIDPCGFTGNCNSICPGGQIISGKCYMPNTAPGVGQSAKCAALETQCELQKFDQSCLANYHVQGCSQAAPGASPGNFPGTTGSIPNLGNLSGLAPANQQLLQQQCFYSYNPNACNALQQYCAQTYPQTGTGYCILQTSPLVTAPANSPQCQGRQIYSNGSQSGSVMSDLTQYLPIITSVVSMLGGGGQTNLGNMPNPQQCAALNNSVNATMCSAYPGTQFTGGSCQCQSGATWTGSSCSTANQCAQYPGTTLVNNQCTCPSGQSWNGSSCVASGTNGATTTSPLNAQLSCAPSIADIDTTPVAVSWLCTGAATAHGDGFDTGGALSGSATVKLKSADLNKGATNVNLQLICNATDSSQKTAVCPININHPFIVADATYSTVHSGDTVTLGWITGGMAERSDACKATADTLPNFSDTGANAVITTPPITRTSVFSIKCTTAGGNTLQADVKITVQ